MIFYEYSLMIALWLFFVISIRYSRFCYNVTCFLKNYYAMKSCPVKEYRAYEENEVKSMTLKIFVTKTQTIRKAPYEDSVHLMVKNTRTTICRFAMKKIKLACRSGYSKDYNE